jgi:hypothetical protein
MFFQILFNELDHAHDWNCPNKANRSRKVIQWFESLQKVMRAKFKLHPIKALACFTLHL